MSALCQKRTHQSLVFVIGGPAAAPAAVLARQFMTHNDLLSGVGDGAALEEAQLLLYPSGGSQERTRFSIPSRDV